MRRAAALLLALAIAGGACSPPAPAPSRPLETGRLGKVQILAAEGAPRGVVFLFSGAEGWGAPETAAASSLAKLGAYVVGVDLASYRRALDANEGECLYLIGEVESLSRQLQREFGLERYFSPLLAGLGEGATLVAAALAQSPAATVAGAVAVDPVSVVRTRLPICSGAKSRREGDGFVYTAVDPLPGFLSVGFSSRADEAARRELLANRHDGDGVRIDRDELSGKAAKPATASAILVDLAGAFLATVSDARDETSSHLVEMRSTLPAAPLVVVLSGDGGWRDIDKRVAAALHDRGLAVIGWDSLRYFWKKRTPEGFAKDLESLLQHYRSGWGAPATALVGYSFGAEVLPFGYNRLSGSEREQVRQISLLGVSDSADFEIRVTDWLGLGDSESKPTQAEISRIPRELLQCFYGEEEEHSVCPGLEATGAEVVRSKGGHQFDGNYEALAARIYSGLLKRGVPMPQPERIGDEKGDAGRVVPPATQPAEPGAAGQ